MHLSCMSAHETGRGGGWGLGRPLLSLPFPQRGVTDRRRSLNLPPNRRSGCLGQAPATWGSPDLLLVPEEEGEMPEKRG